MKMVSPEDEKDIQESGPTDEDIEKIFDFPEAHSITINIIASTSIDGEDKTVIEGPTFQFKTPITKKGFKFDRTINAWVARRHRHDRARGEVQRVRLHRREL